MKQKMLRIFESNRGNGYSVVPPRIPFGYPRKPPKAAIPPFLNLLLLFRHLGL